MRRAFARTLVAMLMVASVPMLVAALSAQTARAGEYDLLFQEFDASGMSEPRTSRATW